jgi:ubiquinone/menaquinone biosynthesis C-methylase UbiE
MSPDSTGDHESERSRLERVYGRYARSRRYRKRWSSENPGNVCLERERESAIVDALRAEDLWPPSGYRVLDLGCGAGHALSAFSGWGARPTDLVGIDLLSEPLRLGRRTHPEINFVQADGSRLPFADDMFQVVIAFTVFSSILDDSVRSVVSSEIDRVIRPGGVLLWYDFRVPNPMNRNTRALDRREIKRTFPTYSLNLRSVTLVPQIARRLGRHASRTYPVVAAVPFLRTHYVGTLRKAMT